MQVAEILQSLFQALSCITFTGALWTVMKVVTALGAQHTQETVEVMLSLCHPSERYVTCAHGPQANMEPLSAVCPPSPPSRPAQNADVCTSFGLNPGPEPGGSLEVGRGG